MIGLVQASVPGTDGQRKRLHAKPVKPPKPFAPTVRSVAEIVPQKVIPKMMLGLVEKFGIRQFRHRPIEKSVWGRDPITVQPESR